LYEYTLLEGQYRTFVCSEGCYRQVASCEALETIVFYMWLYCAWLVARRC